MRDGLEVTRQSAKAAQDSADAAKLGADAAIKSADVAVRQTAIITNRERPWIVVAPSAPEDWPRITMKFFSFRIKWTAMNVGSSPAFLTKLYVAVCVADFPVPNSQLQYREPGSFAEFIVPPKGEYVNEISAELMGTEIEGVLNNRKCIMFYGFVDYRGPFSGPHKTRFCCYWTEKDGAAKFYPVGPPATIEYT